MIALPSDLTHRTIPSRTFQAGIRREGLKRMWP